LVLAAKRAVEIKLSESGLLEHPAQPRGMLLVLLGHLCDDDDDDDEEEEEEEDINDTNVTDDSTNNGDDEEGRSTREER
jgi:hypothetical protein